jgi:hypothetical protein
MRLFLYLLVAGSLAARTDVGGGYDNLQSGYDDLPSDASAARATFERFKRFAGTWTGTSTKGWTETMEIKVIAGGSAVVEMSDAAHFGEAMATMFHMDGDRLLLTHYCIAKNQPRLAATSFEDGGKTVTFTFLDGTGLASRNTGHMDKVVYHFVDDDHASSQWTWYQDGKEQWMEDVTATRQKPRSGR